MSHEAHSAPGRIFVLGCPRSGTTAMAEYLNVLDEVLVSIERYKYVPRRMTDDLFTLERLLDHREGETNIPRERNDAIVRRKDPARLRWVGDKMPTYYKRYGELLEDSPAARFVVMVRPLEEVAESYQWRSERPTDTWPHALERGVKEWNKALRRTRSFVEGPSSPAVLLVDYHAFLGGDEDSAHALASFLGLELSDSVRSAWRAMSASHAERRRTKGTLSPAQLAHVAEHKDEGAERWALERIAAQARFLDRRAFPVARVAPSGNNGHRFEERLTRIDRKLFRRRRWAYLRYLHTREALLATEGVRSMLVVGAGAGWAELALALEFAHVRFHLTDVASPPAPAAQRFVERWGLENVTFGLRDILAPGEGRFDMVSSVEVIEHVGDSALAATHMRAAARRYVFGLVPFAVEAANADPERRARVWREHGHHVVGYDAEELDELFPGATVRGCYWAGAGMPHRERLYAMSDEEIDERLPELRAEAARDLIDAVPTRDGEAKGICFLARVGDR